MCGNYWTAQPQIALKFWTLVGYTKLRITEKLFDTKIHHN
jgi:hypothetical protein